MSRSSSTRNGSINSMGIIVGVALALTFLFTRIFCDSQYETIYRLDPSGMIPPLWILNLLSLLWFFIIGYAMGVIIDPALCKRGNCNEQALIYKGLVAFTVCFFLSHISYSIFFEGKHLFVTILMILTAIACSAYTMIIWTKIKKISALIMGGYCLWLFYLFIVSSSVFVTSPHKKCVGKHQKNFGLVGKFLCGFTKHIDTVSNVL